MQSENAKPRAVCFIDVYSLQISSVHQVQRLNYDKYIERIREDYELVGVIAYSSPSRKNLSFENYLKSLGIQTVFKPFHDVQMTIDVTSTINTLKVDAVVLGTNKLCYGPLVERLQKNYVECVFFCNQVPPSMLAGSKVINFTKEMFREHARCDRDNTVADGDLPFGANTVELSTGGAVDADQDAFAGGALRNWA